MVHRYLLVSRVFDAYIKFQHHSEITTDRRYHLYIYHTKIGLSGRWPVMSTVSYCIAYCQAVSLCPIYYYYSRTLSNSDCRGVPKLGMSRCHSSRRPVLLYYSCAALLQPEITYHFLSCCPSSSQPSQERPGHKPLVPRTILLLYDKARTQSAEDVRSLGILTFLAFCPRCASLPFWWVRSHLTIY